MKFLVLTLFAASLIGCSAGSTACMFRNTADGSRCGICSDGCPSYAPYKCYNTNEIAEQLEFGDENACFQYVAVSSKFTDSQMQDDNSGVPQFGFATIMALFGGSQSLSQNWTSAGNKSLEGIPSCLKPPPSACLGKIPALLNGSLTGKDLQDCANSALLECGEDVAEMALCTYLTAGAGTAFCASNAGQAIFGFVNTFANHFIEKPIVAVADKLEDAAVSVAKKVSHWFSSLF